MCIVDCKWNQVVVTEIAQSLQNLIRGLPRLIVAGTTAIVTATGASYADLRMTTPDCLQAVRTGLMWINL